MSPKIKRDGISLRTIHTWLIIGAVLLSCLMFYATVDLSRSFRQLTAASEQQIELRKAARELMDASDYLTEKVQRFTIQGDRQFMEDYFTEAFVANHREEAIAKMSLGTASQKPLEKLLAAMNASVSLMNREYYAMRLVCEAKGYTDYPKQLQSVVLSPEDRELRPEDKMRRATELVLDEDYYAQKDTIRNNMKASLNELEKMAYDTDASALHTLRDELTMVRIVIALQTIGIVFMVWLTSRLGIHPVLNAVERIKDDRPIPEVGANEFRYLARTYNKMYEVYKKSLDRLNYKASHDELTEVYNRAGYDLLLSGIDLRSTYLLLFDVDNFKTINDSFGHETGDKALLKLAHTLKSHFRSDDYICRVGGDEFVVLMIHTAKNQQELVVSIIDEINQRLESVADGLPALSASVGIAHGSEASDPEALFEQADTAMYQSKQRGKHTYTFYKAS